MQKMIKSHSFECTLKFIIYYAFYVIPKEKDIFLERNPAKQKFYQGRDNAGQGEKELYRNNRILAAFLDILNSPLKISHNESINQ